MKWMGTGHPSLGSSMIKYCTISIYSVVTRHGRAYRNRNVVDVTHHSGLCRKHNWSQLLVWAKFGAAFCLVGSKFRFPGSLQPLAAQILTGVTHKFTKSISGLPKFL